MSNERTPTKLDKLIGKNIRNLRQYFNLSQVGLGEHLGITFQQIQKYERGLNRIAASRLYLLAKLWNISMEDFFLEDL